MKFPIEHSGFEGRGLTLHVGSDSYKLMIDGRAVIRANDLFVVKNNHGERVIIRVNERVLNSIPEVEIGEEKINLALPFRRYEHLASLLPFLMFFGGSLGVIIGLSTFCLNVWILRLRANPREKVNLVFLISCLSFGVFFAIEALLERFFGIPAD